MRVTSDGAGKGSQFVVRLPWLVPFHAGAAKPAVEAAHSASALAGLRVLAVDDNPDALEVVSATLSASGAAVRVANEETSGLAAGIRRPARAGEPPRPG